MHKWSAPRVEVGVGVTVASSRWMPVARSKRFGADANLT